jgi:plasmid stabilization system protein ParE
VHVQHRKRAGLAKSFRLSRRALNDLEEIAEYLGHHSPTAAARVLEKLLEAFDTTSVVSVIA